MPSPTDPHDEHCVRVPVAAKISGAYIRAR